MVGLTSKDLEEKYKDSQVVSELVEKKTASGQWEPNPDFPEREDWLHLKFND